MFLNKKNGKAERASTIYAKREEGGKGIGRTEANAHVLQILKHMHDHSLLGQYNRRQRRNFHSSSCLSTTKTKSQETPARTSIAL